MIIVSTLGFDERPVIRAASSAGFENIEKIVLIRPVNDDPRALKAVSEIKKIAVMAGLREEDIVSLRVDPLDFWGSVSLIYELLLGAAEESREIMLCLGGGLRALVIEAFTAFTLLPYRVRTRFRLRIDLESGRGSITLTGGEIILDTRLSENEEAVLRLLAEEPGLTLTMISDRLVKPVSTIHRVLKKLVERRLVRRIGAKYYLGQPGLTLLKIIGVQKQ